MRSSKKNHGQIKETVDLNIWLDKDHLLRWTDKAMEPHSSTLAWKITWMEVPGGLQSMGSLRVRHDWATSLSLFTFMHWRRKRNPLQCSCLENPRDGAAWWAAVYRVTQSRTRLKWLSSTEMAQLRKTDLRVEKED